ncbi:MAG: hypothetical protein HY842_07300 [Bacteroidetes bacterium]|nr:hypothetical protein [Bacteroidota bacterium]
MKIQISFIFWVAVLVTACVPTRKIVNKTINHNYQNLTFTPEQVKKQSIGKVEMTITPIDAKVLNQETSDAAKRDGNYEKELSLSIEKSKRDLDEMSKEEKAFVQGRIKAVNAVSDLVKRGEIPTAIGYDLQYRIWYGDEYGRDGTEVSSLSEIDNFPDNFNPFKINDKFLSVFKITFENKGSEIEKFNVKDFQITSGEEQLYPLATEYFEENLKNEPEKVKNAYRMNMPMELTLTPNQKVTKYIAVPAINPSNKELQVQYIKDKSVLNFDFAVSAKVMNKSYQVESFDIRSETFHDPSRYDYFFAINYSQGISYAAASTRVFVSEDKKVTPVSIYGIAIENNSSRKVYFGKNENFKFSAVLKNLVKVKLSEIKS